jgi:prepilin peptidase CpaA
MEPPLSIDPILSLVILAAQLLLLLSAAWNDVACRLIPDRISVGLGITGAIGGLMAGPLQLAESLGISMVLFLALLLLHSRQILGGGDVKLLTALSIGLPLAGVVQLFAFTALAGGVLAAMHLAMRHLPRPQLPRTRSLLRRVYAVERWRILRHAPLPYGVAIACGGIWAILTNPGV